MDQEVLIEQTMRWIEQVVIGCNFCPFAAGVVRKGRLHITVEENDSSEIILATLAAELERLDDSPEISTTLIIVPSAVEDFDDYLELYELAQDLMEDLGYEGVYQVASFHPGYLFDGSDDDDPANYTNRSPYPMLHLLREDEVSAAVDSISDPEEIPERNIAFAQKKGLAFMQQLFSACLQR